MRVQKLRNSSDSRSLGVSSGYSVGSNASIIFVSSAENLSDEFDTITFQLPDAITSKQV